MGKAVSRGTCQYCEHVQKLPNGKLASHGYHYAYQSFVGVCQGAFKPPYEESCDLIQVLLGIARKQINGLEGGAEILRQPATEEKAWVHEYSYGGHYEWRVAELVKIDNRVMWVDNKSNRRRLDSAGICHDTRDILVIATELNSLYAKELDRRIKGLTEYCMWQERRIAEWKPAPLLPPKDGE